MSAIFADTWFWIAVLNPKDNHHQQAIELLKTFSNEYLVTTDEVLTETLTYFSSHGFSARKQVSQFIRGLLSSNVEVVPQSRDSFLKGLELYETRPDKQYSLQDCISMQTMRAFQLEDVLTNDKHFAQEGFRVLLRD